MPTGREEEHHPHAEEPVLPTTKGNVYIMHDPSVERTVPPLPKSSQCAMRVDTTRYVLRSLYAIEQSPQSKEAPHHCEFQPETINRCIEQACEGAGAKWIQHPRLQYGEEGHQCENELLKEEKTDDSQAIQYTELEAGRA